MYYRQEKLQLIEDTKKVYEEILAKKDCVTLKDLAVNGKDLMGAGVSQGKAIGAVLKAMLEDVLDNPEHNSKDYLLEPERLKSFLEGSE